jgi:transcriptional regulator with XRE-family HTH domain
MLYTNLMKAGKKQRLVFSQNLVKFRKERGFSQQDLAKLTGLTQRMITYYETEAVKPPVDKIEIIAKALNVSINKLLGISEPTNIQNELIQIDSRSLKKIRTILSLPKHQRHIIYSMADSFSKQNKEKK